TLKEFLSTIQKMLDNDVRMNLQKILHSEKGINFVTSHSSKGLEYRYVFLIGCTSKQWEGQAERSFGFKIPDTITEGTHHDKEEDERRLFYVALTRSKEYLNVSYPGKDSNDRELVCSRFIVEITEELPYQVEHISLSDDDIIQYKMDILQFTEPPVIPLIDDEYLKEILQTYQLSVTHLNKYLKCPISFYFENMLMVPSARTASSGFGSAIHEALKDFFTVMKEDTQKRFPSVEYLSDVFRQKLKNFHSHFTLIEFKNYEEYGSTIVLPELYKTYVNEWRKEVLLEYSIKNIEVEGVPIKGTIDKIELNSDSVNVIDYKTGKFESSKKKLNPPNEREALGGDYWRQIIFYKILIENDRRETYKVLSGELDFVEPDTKTKVPVKHKIFISPDDQQIVLEQIKDSYSRIMKHEFSVGCGEEDCTWCNFVRYNYKPIDIPEKEEGEMV
ncbi:MAG: ATP-dependent helicase, partial [Cytophagales bacterium]|nr:ATP-dependent helicase [Cytophaga sp.]